MILAIDVSSRLGLLSLEMPDGRVLQRVSERSREHLAWLGASLPELRREAGIAWRELERLAVTTGPGSFTGLRIGLAVAKGLVFGSDVPILPLPSLLVPARAHPESALLPVLVCRRARGDESWAAFAPAGDGGLAWERLLAPGELAETAAALPTETVRIGDGAAAEAIGCVREPEAGPQLAALRSLASAGGAELSGHELDRLLPRYLMAPATTRQRSAE